MSIYVKDPEEAIEACVIWMHGLGADAQDMAGLAAQLPLSVAVRHVFLDAPVRPVTLNNHMPMRAWYDILGTSLVAREDKKGISESEAIINQVIEKQLAEGMPAEHIFLAGFSQGGAMALYTGLQSTLPLAGVIALSAYLPLASTCQISLSKDTPFFLAGGLYDPMVLPAWTKQCLDQVRAQGFQQVSFHEYPIEHSISATEVKDLGEWLSACVRALKRPTEGIA